MSAEDNALKEYLAYIRQFEEGGAPQYAQGESISYETLSPEELARLGPSAMEGITTDPRLVNAEMDALRMLEERSKEGLTMQDEADMARLQSDVNRRARGRSGAIQQNMQSRGISGSGLDFMAQMQASQDATEMEALASLEKAAQSQNNKRAATNDLGNMASRQRGQAFAEDAQKAAARDAIERFNTTNSVNQQNRNVDTRNQAVGQNWDRKNSTADKNTGAAYDFRRDSTQMNMGGAQMKYNAATEAFNRAQLAKEAKRRKSGGQFGAVLGAAGGVAGAIYGGPTGAMVGAQLGQGVGNAYGSANYAHGGLVPGDDERNDVVPANLSPGEVVIPRSIADDPAKASEFVAEANGQEMDAVSHLLAAMQMMNKRK